MPDDFHPRDDISEDGGNMAMCKMRIENILLCAILGVIITASAGCHGADRDSAKSLLAEFYSAVTTIEDPLFKNAALNEDAEPDKAKDYFNAHEKLREQVAEAESKAVILAAYLIKQPTALRPLTFKNEKDRMIVTCALGPTDEKKGDFTLVKKDNRWVIGDFDGAWARRLAEKKKVDEMMGDIKMDGEKDQKDEPGAK
jgi:hypothetical protein